MLVKFTPGSIAAILFVNYNGKQTVWVWHSFRKGAESTQRFLHEEHPLIQREISEHFRKLFEAEYNERSAMMDRATSWSIEIED